MTLDEMIQRWTGQEGGAERANYAMFLGEFCDVLGLPKPDPAGGTEHNDYVFERSVKRPDGSNGRIDLYKRDCFVLEAKQSRQKPGEKYVDAGPQLDLLKPGPEPEPLGRRSASRAWDVLMLNARQQAEDYARHLPQHHGWPPFVIVCDVGHSFEFYADFRRMGKYEQFPDRRGYRIYLEDLRKEEVRERIRAIWTDPHSLDPTKKAAKATREIARRLAEVSKALEAKGYNAEEVAHFLMRCLFTMFSEDVGLLPKESFKGLLEDTAKNPASFAPLLSDLWTHMNDGTFAPSIRAAVKRFNGACSRMPRSCRSPRRRSACSWRRRARTGGRSNRRSSARSWNRRSIPRSARNSGRITRRAPMSSGWSRRRFWSLCARIGGMCWRRRRSAAPPATAPARWMWCAPSTTRFARRACSTRPAAPAIFLYVSLELMKRLEGGGAGGASGPGRAGGADRLEGHTVDPNQFLGLELNPRAAAIAELVLWIGYLQWHYRTKGGDPGERF
jgi:hypothetical protein